MLPYQERVFELIKKYSDIKNTKMLEIGGVPNQAAIASTLINSFDADEVFQINRRKDLKDITDNRLKYYNMDALSVNFNDDYFDVCFGAAVLEHISGLDVFFKEMHRVLKGNGHLILHGAPLWSSHWGHHLWVHIDNVKYEFNGFNPVPDWGHLLLSEGEMQDELIRKDIPKEHVSKIIEMVYKGNEINRIGYDEIIDIIERSDFKIVEIINRQWKKPTDEIMSKVDIPNLSLGEMIIVLRKIGNTMESKI